MRMLHSRRKAEIEILSTMKPDRSSDNRQEFSSGAYPTLTACWNPDRDLTAALDDDLADLPSSDCSSASLCDSWSTSATAMSVCASPSTSPPSSPFELSHTKPPAAPYTPLARYLIRKIGYFVAQAQSREDSMVVDA